MTEDSNGRPTKRWPAPWMAGFLTALGHHGVVKHACDTVGVARSAVYVHREDNVEFAAAWEDAVQESTDNLEREAIRRAVEGTEEPVFHRGEVVGALRKYSDVLLIFMLKGRRPTVYRDRWLGQPAAGGKPLADMTLADLAAAAAPDGDD